MSPGEFHEGGERTSKPGTTLPGMQPVGQIVAIVRQDLLANAELDELLDPKTLNEVLERLQPLIETEPIEPGQTLPVRMVAPDALSTISVTAAIDAAGLRPSSTEDEISVVWTDMDDELVVHVGGVSTSTGDGFVDVTIPVECDQTGRVDVVVTLVTAHPDHPFGAMFATTHRPHGPRAVIDVWSEALIAFAWSTVAMSASLIAASAGRDRDGRQLAPTSIVATKHGLGVVPMAEHRFVARAPIYTPTDTDPGRTKRADGRPRS